MIDSNVSAKVAFASAQTDPRPTLLFVDPSCASEHVPALRSHFRVTAAATEREALRALALSNPAFVVTELTLPEGNGLAICREAKAHSPASRTVLVMTEAVDRIPVALAAGCDAVLVKPFAPNLLYARLGRLVRQSNGGRNGRSPVLPDPATDFCCPTCQGHHVVAFDHASYRREWFACLECERVWIAARHEGLRGNGTRS